MTDAVSATGWPHAGIWRHHAELPIRNVNSIVSFGEGDTPVLDLVGPTLSALPLGSLALKAEDRNPTGSFKDRIASVAASMIRERGLRGAVGTSSGNGGAAMAAYGARAGFPVVLFIISGIVDGKLLQILAHGARAYTVQGFGLEADATSTIVAAIKTLAQEEGWLAFLTGANHAPEAMRGAETIAAELLEQVPRADAVSAPVGGGGLLASLWRGYRRCGDATNPPRLVGVQPAGCRTLQRGLAGDLSPLSGSVTTTLSGLQVSELFDYGAVDAVAASGGHVVEIADEQAWEAQHLLADEEGVFVEPAGSTALAGLLADVASGRVGPDDNVVVVNSGAGHKDENAVRRLAAGNPAQAVGVGDLGAILADVGRGDRS